MKEPEATKSKARAELRDPRSPRAKAKARKAVKALEFKTKATKEARAKLEATRPKAVFAGSAATLSYAAAANSGVLICMHSVINLTFHSYKAPLDRRLIFPKTGIRTFSGDELGGNDAPDHLPSFFKGSQHCLS